MSVLALGPPAITTGTGILSTTFEKESISPVYNVLTISAPHSAPILAVCATTSGSWGFLTFSPLGYIIANKGTFHS